jgi:hypothetical protein
MTNMLDLVARENAARIVTSMRAENEARFPTLKAIKTHPALDCIPLMTDDEFARLVWSIRKIGLIHPIVQDENGRILDGRCRYLACEIAGVEPTLAPPKDAVDLHLWVKHRAPESQRRTARNHKRAYRGPGSG